MLTLSCRHPAGNSNPFHFVLNNGPGMEGGLYSQVWMLSHIDACREDAFVDALHSVLPGH